MTELNEGDIICYIRITKQLFRDYRGMQTIEEG